MNLWLVNTYKNRYHQLIKLWHTDVESKAHISSDIEKIYNDPNFKVGNPVRISKYKKTLQNITKLLKKLKNTVTVTMTNVKARI